MTNYITIHKNIYKKSDKHPDLGAIISINEDLKAGVYEAGLFQKISQKGNKIYNGTIRAKVSKEKPVQSFHEVESSDDDNSIPF